MNPHRNTVQHAIAECAIAALREQVLVEGPHTIAAIVHEVGLVPPFYIITWRHAGRHWHQRHNRTPSWYVELGVVRSEEGTGYLEGVRAICDEFGIMMASDEVKAQDV